MMSWWQHISTKYPWIVVGISVLVIVLAGWYASGLFGNLSEEEMDTLAATPSKTMKTKMTEFFGASPSAQIVLFERNDASLGEVSSPAYQAEISRILAPLREEFTTVQSYVDQPSDTFVSRDKTATYAIVSSDKGMDETYRLLAIFERETRQTRLDVSIGGEAASVKQTTHAANGFLAHAEMVSVPILLVLLVLFFRSGVAALIPLVMSGVTVVGAFAIARLISSFMTIDTYAVNVITILGLGLSIDYALLSVSRFREELGKGSVNDAVRTIIATTGRTIFFSGVTVAACLLSLLVFPVEMLHSIAVGVAAAVAVAVAFTVIVLPSILQLIGTRIDALHLPMSKHTGESRFWSRVAHLTTSHPLIALIGGLVVVGIAIVPLSQFRPGMMDHAWLARGSSSQYVAQYMVEKFDAQAPSVTALVVLPSGTKEWEKLDIACDMSAKLRAVDGVKQVVSSVPLPAVMPCTQFKQMMLFANVQASPLTQMYAAYSRENALKFDVSLDVKSGSGAAADVLAAIRNLKPTKGDYYVGGSEAVFVDNNQLYYDAMPWAALIIAGSMIVLLALSLRSVVLPIQAVLINSVALAISMAVIVGVFQLGWFRDLTGWLQTTSMILTAPILVIAIAFGLAMDYSVFLYSRMREVYDRTSDPKQAIVEGVVRTGPIITAAALALFVVIAAFAFSQVMLMQIIGVGLGVAVLVDAFFVRLILVPSLMALMGRASWYAPKWVARCSIRHE